MKIFMCARATTIVCVELASAPGPRRSGRPASPTRGASDDTVAAQWPTARNFQWGTGASAGRFRVRRLHVQVVARARERGILRQRPFEGGRWDHANVRC